MTVRAARAASVRDIYEDDAVEISWKDALIPMRADIDTLSIDGYRLFPRAYEMRGLLTSRGPHESGSMKAWIPLWRIWCSVWLSVKNVSGASWWASSSSSMRLMPATARRGCHQHVRSRSLQAEYAAELERAAPGRWHRSSDSNPYPSAD